MVVMTTPLYWLWLIGSAFSVLVNGYLAFALVSVRRATRHIHEGHDEMVAENWELKDTLCRRSDHHACFTPQWGPKGHAGDWVAPELGVSYLCPCGVRYVLARAFRPDAGVPFRLSWVTETEARTGAVPLWDRQPPENRLGGPPTARHRGGRP